MTLAACVVTEAYDRKVAGIVSGVGALKPGIASAVAVSRVAVARSRSPAG